MTSSTNDVKLIKGHPFEVIRGVAFCESMAEVGMGREGVVVVDTLDERCHIQRGPFKVIRGVALGESMAEVGVGREGVVVVDTLDERCHIEGRPFEVICVGGQAGGVRCVHGRETRAWG